MTLKRLNTCDTQSELKVLQITVLIKCHVDKKEDIGTEQQLYEIVRGKNFALNYLSWKLTEMIMITNKVIPENLVVVR